MELESGRILELAVPRIGYTCLLEGKARQSRYHCIIRYRMMTLRQGG